MVRDNLDRPCRHRRRWHGLPAGIEQQLSKGASSRHQIAGRAQKQRRMPTRASSSPGEFVGSLISLELPLSPMRVFAMGMVMLSSRLVRGLHWGLRIGQFHSARQILIYAKQKETFFGDASFYRRTGFDR